MAATPKKYPRVARTVNGLGPRRKSVATAVTYVARATIMVRRRDAL
jgi:hypothetical protein